MQDIDWRNIRLLIFDVDGTLYDQQRLRRRMFLDLAGHFLPRPGKWNELSILRTFRKEREKNREIKVDDLDKAQYEWCRLKTDVNTEKIRATVSFWMHEYPLKYLPDLVFPGIPELFSGTRKLRIPVAVFSDYPAEKKLQSMGLAADLVITATQPEVNRLKPDPKGLLYIADHFQVAAQECLYIGDRKETDMEAATRARMNCIIADRKQIYAAALYTQILSQLAR